MKEFLTNYKKKFTLEYALTYLQYSNERPNYIDPFRWKAMMRCIEKNRLDDRIIVIEGMDVVVSKEEIQPGDVYVAKRNTGWKILTAREIGNGCIHSVESGYSFDIRECFKVVKFED